MTNCNFLLNKLILLATYSKNAKISIDQKALIRRLRLFARNIYATQLSSEFDAVTISHIDAVIAALTQLRQNNTITNTSSAAICAAKNITLVDAISAARRVERNYRDKEHCAVLLHDLFDYLTTPLPVYPIVDTTSKLSWLTPTILTFAKAIYDIDSNTLNRHDLLELSDALEEAGCSFTDLKLTMHYHLLLDKRGSYSIYRCVEHPEYDGDPAVITKCPDCLYIFKNVNDNISSKELRQVPPLIRHLREPGPHYRGCWAIDWLLGLT